MTRAVSTTSRLFGDRRKAFGTVPVFRLDVAVEKVFEGCEVGVEWLGRKKESVPNRAKRLTSKHVVGGQPDHEKAKHLVCKVPHGKYNGTVCSSFVEGVVNFARRSSVFENKESEEAGSA